MNATIYLTFIMNIKEMNEISFKVTGRLKDNIISFYDPENILNELIIEQDYLIYRKDKGRLLNFRFRKNKTTKGVYKYGGLLMNFDVFTKTIQLESDYIKIDYELLQDDRLVNIHELEIIYKIVV